MIRAGRAETVERTDVNAGLDADIDKLESALQHGARGHQSKT